jgi:hypothetical protein
MPSPTDFAKLVPGFDFMQNLMKNAGQVLPNTLPNINQWIAPTLDPEELGKRIEQLRTVQFWLEQNAKVLGATIQALEVQRMTLSTLKTMNMPMDRMRDAFKLTPDAGSDAAPAAQPQAVAAAAAKKPRSAPARKTRAAAPPSATPAVDPMQWWGALTQQFTELATNALKDSGSEAAKAIAGQALKAAVKLPGKVVGAGLGAAKKRR